MHDDWLANEEHSLTAQGNMRAPSRSQMIEWVLEAWKKLPSDLIKKSFKVCALSSNLDGSEDGQIMCIKNGPCQELLTRFQSVEVDELDPFDDIQEDEEEDCSESEDSDNDVVEVV